MQMHTDLVSAPGGAIITKYTVSGMIPVIPN